MPKIAIVGPGAIGCAMAVALSRKPGNEVVLCARSEVGPLTLEMPGKRIQASIDCLTNPVDAPLCDWILFATKTYQSKEASSWIDPLSREGTRVAILQCGVEQARRFEAFCGKERIVPVSIDCPVERRGRANVRLRGRAALSVADDENGRAFASLFSGQLVDVALESDMKTCLWRALCLDAAGSVSAIGGQTMTGAYDQGIDALIRALIRECLEVGHAEGADLDDDLPDEIVKSYRKTPYDRINSMQADKLAGRRTEHDAKHGVVVRLGAKHGIETPLNYTIAMLLSASDPE